MNAANLIAPVVRVWLATITEADHTLRAWLDERERERLTRYQASADQARFLLGAAMLRLAVGAELGIRPEQVPVDRSCAECGRWHGRPVVTGTTLALSVSHGGFVVALALAPHGPVGIDVERIGSRPVPEVRAWTQAEARFKAGGGEGLLVEELSAPVAGHVLTLVRSSATVVHVSPARSLLSARPGPR